MPRLKIISFGPFQAFLDDFPLIFDTDKARALLIYLTLHSDQPQHRQRLAGLFWSDMPEARALHNLRQTLSVLRKTVRDHANTVPFLLIQRDFVQINPQGEVWLDADVFMQEIDAVFQHYQHGSVDSNLDCRLNLRRLQKAISLFRGPFLDQIFLDGSPLFDEWAGLQRESLNQKAIEALTVLTRIMKSRGEYSEALRFARRIAALAPWDETAQAEVIQLLAIEGQWSAAQAQYHHLRQYLRDELGVTPAPETEALFAGIRQSMATKQPFNQNLNLARHNLPKSITPFVGRQKELESLADTLADPHCHLLTLHGPGGVGKTRLAIQAAEEQRGIFRDGVFYISLDSITKMEFVSAAIYEALKLSSFGTDPLEVQLLRFLDGKHMLWVLDNLEQLLPLKPANLFCQILQSAQGITILATSRQRLNLQEEYLFPVEGLSLPQSADTTELIEQQDAIQLFVKFSQRVWPQFNLTIEPERLAVVKICQLLEGLPLGIELAAASLWAQKPSEIAIRLSDNLRGLATESVNAHQRHRSLWAAFEASWMLLLPAEQQLLALLSVYRRGFDAGLIQGGLSPSQELLSALIDKSLLRRNLNGRYEMHEAIRQYAAEKLSLDSDQSNVAHAAHAQSLATFLQTRTSLLKSAGQLQALSEIALEWENVRQAWAWLIMQRDAEALAKCAEAMFHFCTIRTRFQEGIDLYHQAINELSEAPETEAKLLTYQGALAFRVQENDLCESALNRALEIFDTIHAHNDHALCLVYASGMASRRKNLELARQRCLQSLALFELTEDAWGRSYALYQLGLLETRAGHVAETREAFLASLQIARTIGDLRRQIGPLNLLGDLACQIGEYAVSQTYFEEALLLSRSLDDRFNIAQALINLGTAFHYAAEYERARALYEESLVVSSEIGDLANQSLALINLGELLLATRQFTASINFLRQGLAVAEKAGDEWAVLICWIGMCEVAVAQEDSQAAAACLMKTLPLAQQSGEPALLLRTLLQQGRLYLLQGQLERAIVLLGLVNHHEATYDEHRQAARQALDQAGLPIIDTTSDIALEKVVETELQCKIFAE